MKSNEIRLALEIEIEIRFGFDFDFEIPTLIEIQLGFHLGSSFVILLLEFDFDQKNPSTVIPIETDLDWRLNDRDLKKASYLLEEEVKTSSRVADKLKPT